MSDIDAGFTLVSTVNETYLEQTESETFIKVFPKVSQGFALLENFLS